MHRIFTAITAFIILTQIASAQYVELFAGEPVTSSKGVQRQGPSSLGGAVTVTTLPDVKVTLGKGQFSAQASPNKTLRAELAWDGDALPGVTSASGLGCFDLSRGARQIIIEDFHAKCPAGQQITVKIVAFDGRDPTGARYSWAQYRRRAVDAKRAISIPFSSLVREGPNGSGDPGCVGALTISLIADDRCSQVSFGVIRTSGIGRSVGPQPLNRKYGPDYAYVGTPPPITPEPTATPTSTATVTAVATQIVTPQPVATKPAAPPLQVFGQIAVQRPETPAP